MRKKELIVFLSVTLAGILITGCSGKNIPAADANGEGDSDINNQILLASGDYDEDSGNNHSSSSNQDVKNVKFSEDFLVGIDYGGIPFWYDDVYDTVSSTVIVTTDKKAEVFMGQGLYDAHDTLVDTVSLTDEQYSAIEKAIDQKELYKLDPGRDENMCDGVSRYLYLYDENNNLLKEVGGYEPTNKKFLNMYEKVDSNLPYEEITEIMEKQKAVMRVNDCLNDVYRYSEDDLILQAAEQTITSVGEEEALYNMAWTDDTEKCFRVEIANKNESFRNYKDYFFYREDDSTVIPIAVEYPKTDEKGANRYFEDGEGELKAILEDVNFDGHEDLIISLVKSKEVTDTNKVYCAYVYDNGEFVYAPSFEKILNYSTDYKRHCIISEKYENEKAAIKKYVYDKTKKDFIEWDNGTANQDEDDFFTLVGTLFFYENIGYDESIMDYETAYVLGEKLDSDEDVSKTEEEKNLTFQTRISTSKLERFYKDVLGKDRTFKAGYKSESEAGISCKSDGYTYTYNGVGWGEYVYVNKVNRFSGGADIEIVAVNDYDNTSEELTFTLESADNEFGYKLKK